MPERISLVLLGAAALAGCKAELPDGVFVCVTEAECPNGFVCRTAEDDDRSYCYRAGSAPGARPGADGGTTPHDGGADAAVADNDAGGARDAGGVRDAGGAATDAAAVGDAGADAEAPTDAAAGDAGGTQTDAGNPDAAVPKRCDVDHGGCDPLVTCTEVAAGRECGPCPATHGGDGESGCRLLWVVQLGTATDEFALGAVSDADGNLYLSGETSAALLGGSHRGNRDAFLLKYDASGEHQWTAQFGTGDGDASWGLGIDADDNLYVTGFAGPGLHGVAYAGNADFFLVKYDSGGTRAWTLEHGTPEYDISTAIAVDGNNVYLAGRTDDAFTGFNNAGPYDSVLMKYDAGGQFDWVQQWGSTAHDEAYAVAVDASGAVYVAGVTRGDMGGQTHANPNGEDAYLTRFDADGNLQWTRLLGSTAWEEARSLVTDGTDVFVMGRTSGDLDGETNHGDYDQFVARYDSSGAHLWTTLTGGTLEDDARGAVLDAAGNLYVSGATKSDVDGDNAGGFDMMVTKYDNDGKLLWLRRLGTDGEDEARALALDPAGGVYVTGNITGALPGQTNAGGRDVVLIRYDATGNRR